MNKINMTYQEMIGRANMLNAIPLTKDDKSMPASLMVPLLLIQVEYNQQSRLYDNLMNEVLSNMKPSDFDTHYEQYIELKDKEPKSDFVVEFETKINDLNENLAKAQKLKNVEQCPAPLPLLSDKQFEMLVNFLGTDGYVKINDTNEIPMTDFIKIIAMNLVAIPI